MSSYAIFRNGRWIEYTPRIAFETAAHAWDAAAIFATARSRGFTEDIAHTLAEALVFKRLYKGIQYDESVERLLRIFMDHVETA